MKKQFILAVLVILTLSACAPVRLTTSLKKRPEIYTENFVGDTIKSPRSEVNRKPWIVYSLCDNNPTYRKPNGKLTLQEMSFMEPMLVIGTKQKGRYLKLIKYNPELIKNEKLGNHKKAEYYGWVDRNAMLLYNNSVTDIRTGFKNMSLTTISDTTTLFYPKTFMDNDSVKVFSNPRLTDLNTQCGLYQLVFKYLPSIDGKKWLIGTQPAINASNVTDVMLGWIDGRMLEDVGQRMWYEPADRDPSLPEMLQIAPVITPLFQDSAVVFRSLNIYPAVDPTSNVIYNVNGNPISYLDRIALANELRRINIFFTIEPSRNLAAQYPAFINAIQNMMPFFDENDEYEFTFNVVADKNLYTLDMSLTDIIDWLMDNRDRIIKNDGRANNGWESLNYAADLAANYDAATNLFINIGERVNGGEISNRALKNKITSVNGRLLAFQLYAKDDNAFNNYVLQAADMIESYASSQIDSKRDLWVYLNQVCNEAAFSENTINSFMLDFPKASASQGMIAFPLKGEYLSADVLVSATDTLIKQIKDDNTSLIDAFDRAFASTRNSKDKYTKSISGSYLLADGRKIGSDYREVFTEGNTPWIAEKGIFRLNAQDTIAQPVYLLVTEYEAAPILTMLEELSAMEVDMKGTKKKEKKKVRELSDVRREMAAVNSEQLFSNIYHNSQINYENDSLQSLFDEPISYEYASTGKIRKHLYRAYINAIKNSGRTECLNRDWLKDATLSDVHQLYTMFPATSPVMSNLRVKDIRNSHILSDQELDELITYLKSKAEEIDAELNPSNEVAAGDMRYYKINRVLLP